MTRHAVRCGGLARRGDPEERWELGGFASPAAWAERRIAHPATRMVEADAAAPDPAGGGRRA